MALDDVTKAEILEYQEAHPEIDWTCNEVLYTYDRDTNSVIPGGHWSFEQRDETYKQMESMGFDVRWDEDQKVWVSNL